MKGPAMRAARFGLALMLALGSAQALAEGVAADKSEIRFVANQLGVNVEGRFKRFKANVNFRPNALPSSKAEFEIDLSSVDLASEDSEREVKGSMWFDAKRFPVARFTSTSFRDLGGGKYQMSGKLSMKGITRDVTLPFAVTRDSAGNRVAESSFSLKRLEFKVGEGEWGDPDTVSDAVSVRVRMVLTPEG